MSVEQLLAIEHIRQLKARYCRAVDTKDWQELAAVFTEDAEFDVRNSRRNGDDASTVSEVLDDTFLIRGRDNIINFIRKRAAGVVTVHHGHTAEIDILSACTARAIVPMEDRNRRIEGGKVVYELWGYGHYRETYQREPGGRWQIETLKLTRLRVDITGDFIRRSKSP